MSRQRQRKFRLSVEALERREMLSIGGLLGAASMGTTAAVADDYGNTIATATAIALSSTGAGSQSGQIEKSGDIDVFSFVAPVSGQLTIQQTAATGSRIDSLLAVYNAKGQLVAQNDDYGMSLNSRVDISVTAAATYYVRAAAYGRSTGAYTVQFSAAATTVTDDYANTFADATSLTLASDGSGSQAGKIETAGDVDMFKFTATVTGQMTIQQVAASGSRVDAFLYVYDANQTLLAQNDDSNGSNNSSVTVSVTAGTTYYVKAAAYGRTTGAYTLTLSTVASNDDGTTTPTTGGFQIDMTVSGMTTAQQQIVQEAVDRWESVIVAGGSTVQDRGQTISGIAITLTATSIDGVNGVLGQSAATAFRRDSGLPYRGFIQLDTADVAAMQAEGSLLGVLVHEMAHVLGFGTVWQSDGLLTGVNTSNPRFTGANATAEYNSIFHTSATSVPVESSGGSGTAYAHWSESVLGNELMTGWYNSGLSNPLSRITVASMADLGYQVNMAAADSYSPSTSVTTFSTSTTSSYRSSGTATLRVIPASTSSAASSAAYQINPTIADEVHGRSGSVSSSSVATMQSSTTAGRTVAGPTMRARSTGHASAIDAVFQSATVGVHV